MLSDGQRKALSGHLMKEADRVKELPRAVKGAAREIGRVLAAWAEGCDCACGRCEELRSVSKALFADAAVAVRPKYVMIKGKELLRLVSESLEDMKREETG